MTATTKTITAINSASTAWTFVPETMSTSIGTGTPVYHVLDQIDWGRPAAERWTRRRPLQDGQSRLGKVYGSRVIVWRVVGRVDTAVVALDKLEGARDEAIEDFLDFFNTDNGPFWLRVQRQNAAGGTVTRQIKAEPTGQPSWAWQPDDVGDGLVGLHNGTLFTMPVEFEADYPWFQDVTPLSATGIALGTAVTTGSITNGGHRRCGAKVILHLATGADITVVVSNGTTGAAITDVGNGITLTNLYASAGDVTIDWYGSDPLTWSVVQGTGSTDIRTKLGITSGLWFARGTQTYSVQVTSGSPAGCTADLYLYQLWDAP